MTIDIKKLMVDWMPLCLSARQRCGVELFAKIGVTQHPVVVRKLTFARESEPVKSNVTSGFVERSDNACFVSDQIVRQPSSHLGLRSSRIQIIERSVAVEVCVLAIATIIEKVHKKSLRNLKSTALRSHAGGSVFWSSRPSSRRIPVGIV